jgi:hypothetical protein
LKWSLLIERFFLLLIKQNVLFIQKAQASKGNIRPNAWAASSGWRQGIGKSKTVKIKY